MRKLNTHVTSFRASRQLMQQIKTFAKAHETSRGEVIRYALNKLMQND